MSINKKIEKLAVKLTKETYSESITWSNENPPSGLTKGTDDFFPLYLECEYKGVDIGIYIRRYKHYYDEFEYSWTEDVGICMPGDHGQISWEYEERSPALINLFDAAKEQASGINEILNDLLNE